jgi:hypothetical protein
MVRPYPYGGGTSVLTVVYVLIGAIVASQHDFFAHLTTIKLLLSALLAVALWPLILLGVNLHLH